MGVGRTKGYGEAARCPKLYVVTKKAQGEPEIIVHEDNDILNLYPMTTLITGGTGKTGLALAKLLHQASLPLLITSRKGVAPEPYKAVKFDWFDPSTFGAPFEVDTSIEKVFLIDPPTFDVFPHVKPFIDLAIARGVKRFVVVTTTQTNPGDIPLGLVHQYILDLGVDYTVLRPTWFIENFGVELRDSIRDDHEIASSGEDGRVPFVSAVDLAQAAFEALTREKSHNKDFFVLGPVLHSYDEVASMFTELLGKKIVHKRNSVDQQTQIFGQFLSPEYAAHLARVEHLIAEGGEEKFFHEPADRKFIGTQTLANYLQVNRDLWM